MMNTVLKRVCFLNSKSLVSARFSCSLGKRKIVFVHTLSKSYTQPSVLRKDNDDFQIRQEIVEQTNATDAIWDLNTIDVKVPCISNNLKCNNNKFADVSVSYVDSHANSDEKENTKGVVLCIHGTPGVHEHYLELGRLLYEEGYRVIIPNMPGHGFSKVIPNGSEKNFFYSTEQNSFLVEYFLRHIEVDTVDLAIGHSAGCGQLIVLGAQNPKGLKFKTSLFLCSLSGHTPQKLIRPRILFTVIEKFLYIDSIWNVLGHVIQLIAIKKKVKSVNKEHLRVILHNALHINFDLLTKAARTYKEKQIPVVYVYAERDPYVSPQHSKEYAEMFGINEENTSVYDKDGICTKEAVIGNDHYAKGYLLQKGMKRTHYPQKSDILRPVMFEEAMRLLKIAEK